MFNVELNDDGVEMAYRLFGETPVLVYTRWANYTGTCVWRCNQYSTYSLSGEPKDERYLGIFDDGVFTETITKEWFDGPTRRMWKLLQEKYPEEYATRRAATDRSIEFDRETMFVLGAARTGGVAKKDEKGDWTIEDKPRKKILGIF